MARWLWFLVVLLTAGLGLLSWNTVAGPPAPGFECDPTAVRADQLARSSAFGLWLLYQFLVLAAFTGVASFAAFYFQLFHASLRSFGSLARVVLCLVISALAGAKMVFSAADWAARQITVEGPSCLVQALRTDAAKKVALTGVLFARPEWWRYAALADMALLVALGMASGFLMYLLSRRLFKI